MIIQLKIEVVPTRIGNHTYIPDEFVADDYEKKQLTLLGLTGYVRELVVTMTHTIADVDCEICMAIVRGMARLIDEGREMEMKKKNV